VIGERKTIPSSLAGATLTGSQPSSIDYRPVAVMPDVRIVKLGGQSIMDRGRTSCRTISRSCRSTYNSAASR